MYKALQSYAIMAMMLLSTAVIAAETPTEQVAIVTLENGATVKLNDDFTWEYVFLEPQTAAVNPPDTKIDDVSETSSSVSSPKISGPVAGTTLTATAIDQAALLKSTAKGGAKVSYLNSQWDNDGRLGLNFELSNNSEENYVIIEMEISLFADSGQLIKKETIDVWQAIFRVPETYLRKGQTRNSNTFWIEGIDKAQWNKELMTLKIVDMSSR